MKVAKVFLRWYKSFNISYAYTEDRRAGVQLRPWNRIGRESDNEDIFPFIEIPLGDDITTIVGANESGKSHLLSAISKVLTGHGIPEARGRTGTYSRTDLCHYTSPRSKNAEDWPHVGLQFGSITHEELKKIGDAIDNSGIGDKAPPDNYRITLILAPNKTETKAHLYLDSNSALPLNDAKLQAVRKCLPRVEFIKSELAISDQVPIAALAAAYGGGTATNVFDYNAAQKLAQFIHSLTLAGENPQVPPDFGKQLAQWKTTLAGARLNDRDKAELEALLFKDVMGITAETLRFVADLPLDDRTHADSLTAKWNREIDELLNLSHYWQQDDSFALRVNFKQGILYFEITDKTGATYTFRERSSGLRYFLSYYIQAKALELTSRGRNAIVLMDEPDSFLSIIGQRNLLAVFESLVRAESSGQSCQLVYTTHSPFLINKNYPHRLRLVRKGDAEEGTQLVDAAMLRRYEPVRSALGIDCAQTLFMGATNVVVEGPTDQYLLAELIRRFIRPDNVSELLDLNSVVVVSAESAPGVEKLLAASQWGDEPVPATVVLLDSDQAGDEIKAKIVGKGRTNQDRIKKLIEEQYVLQIGTILGDHTDQKTVTTEDIIPPKLFAMAVERYVQRWHPEKYEAQSEALRADLANSQFAAKGLVAATTEVFNRFVHPGSKSYDKMGVMQEIVSLLNESGHGFDGEVQALGQRLLKLCHEVRRTVSASQQAARRTSGKQSVQRLVKDFFKTHKEASSVFDIQLLLERLQRDSKLLGQDGEKLDAALSRLLSELAKARSAHQTHFRDQMWMTWKKTLEAIYENPLEITVQLTEDGPQPVHTAPMPKVDTEADDRAGASAAAAPAH